MSKEIKSGSVVKLKSGGPLMTVNRVGNDPAKDLGVAYCSWFSNDEQYLQGNFNCNALDIEEV